MFGVEAGGEEVKAGARNGGGGVAEVEDIKRADGG